jgi:4'-phosphopantetheinyl transferase
MNDSLSEDQVLVFYGNISEFDIDDCLRVLSEKEIARAEQFLVPLDKRRHLISRAILKLLLAHFSAIDVQKIAISSGKNGKPILSDQSDLQFNLSHSEEMFVIGFSRGTEIGIDIECLHRTPTISLLEPFLFTPTEQKLFRKVDESQRKAVFIQSWTRKEAFLKASGDGLTKAMNELNLAFINDETFSLDSIEGMRGDQTNWFLESYTVMDHYCGAVAVKGSVKSVRYIPMNEFTF